MSTLAIRNNNPGNLRDTSTGSFRTFSNPQEGYAALLNDLEAKQTGNTSTGLGGHSTLADFASKYAPAGDNNDPVQYTANLANEMGVAPNTQLKDLDLNKWAQAVTKSEDRQNAANLGFTDGGQQTAPIQPPAAPQNSPLQAPVAPTNPFGADSAYAGTGGEQEAPRGLVGQVGGFLKGLVSTPATLVARPFQLAAQLGGATPEQVNKYNFGGLVAPVPQNASDVIRDVGRGLETVSYGVGGGAVVKGLGNLAKGSLIQGVKTGALQGTKAGALAGLGSELEDKGTDTSLGGLTTSTLGGAAIGGATGGLLPIAGAVAKNVIPGLARGGTRLAGKAIEGAENATQRAAVISKAPKAEKAAMRSGIQDEVINFVKNTNPTTRRSFEKMLDTHKSAVNNPHPSAPQAKQVPGKTFLKAVDAVQKGSGRAAAKLKSIAAKNPGVRVDASPAFKEFLNVLEKKGIRMDSKGRFHSEGKVPSSEMKFYDSISKEINAIGKSSPKLTRMQIHQMRQRLWATLDSATKQGGAPGQRPYSNDVDMDVQVLRRSLAKLLGKEYETAAKDFAQNEEVLRSVAKMAGTTIDELSTKDRKLGEVLMRTLGNASDRPLALIEDTLKAAKRNGFKSDEDILAQLRFADILENAYGSTQTRSLGGQVARGVKDAAMDIGQDAVTGNVPGMLSKTVTALAGKSTDDQTKAFESFIREQSRGSGLVNVRR